MMQVDPDDDSLRRFVVRRYAYDPARRERRSQDVAAFDNQVEFERMLTALGRELADRRTAGATDAQENISGVLLEPNHRRSWAAHHAQRRAIRHGRGLSDAALNRIYAQFEQASGPAEPGTTQRSNGGPAGA